MPTRAVLFDFDGTLADSFRGITASTNHVRTSYGLEPVSEDVVRRYVGFGLPNLMENLVPTAPTADAVTLYRAHHPSVMLSGTTLFPGVADTLAELHRRGYRLAVCSNKLSAFTKQLVGVLGVAAYFGAALGPDDVGVAKPDPAMLLEALRRLEVSRDDGLYVGDMAIDVHAGRAAGLPVWLVMGGATGLEPPTDAGPDRVLATFADLLDLLPGV